MGGELGAEQLLAMALAGEDLDVQGQALRDALRQRGVSESTCDRLFRHVEDAVGLWPTDQETHSRLGGPGLLPKGAEWPSTIDGRPMSPVAVFDFDELPRLAPLPQSGKLVVYWDFAWVDVGIGFDDFVAATHVFWAPSEDLQQREPPASLEAYGLFAQVNLQGARIPVAGEPSLLYRELEGVGDRAALFDAMNELAPGLYRHQLLGTAREVQISNPLAELGYWFSQDGVLPETKHRFSESELAGEGWRLLAQLDDEGQMTFLDASSMYLLIPEQDLRDGRFDRVMGLPQRKG